MCNIVGSGSFVEIVIIGNNKKVGVCINPIDTYCGGGGEVGFYISNLESLRKCNDISSLVRILTDSIVLMDYYGFPRTHPPKSIRKLNDIEDDENLEKMVLQLDEFEANVSKTFHTVGEVSLITVKMTYTSYENSIYEPIKLMRKAINFSENEDWECVEVWESETVDMKTGIITVETSHEMYCVDFDDVLGKKFLVIGRFDEVNEEEYYKSCIEDNGGIIVNDLTDDVDYLISNDMSLICDAQERHIAALTESEFLKKFYLLEF